MSPAGVRRQNWSQSEGPGSQVTSPARRPGLEGPEKTGKKTGTAATWEGSGDKIRKPR